MGSNSPEAVSKVHASPAETQKRLDALSPQTGACVAETTAATSERARHDESTGKKGDDDTDGRFRPTAAAAQQAT